MIKPFKSLLEFQKHFGTDAKCRAYLEQQRWGKIPYCPYCGSIKVYRLKDGKRINCGEKGCKRVFTVTVGTFYENTKIPLNKWFLAMYVAGNHSKGISSLQLAGYIDVTQTTAWFLLHRIRAMMEDKSTIKLRRTVEVDETYVGAKRSNKHAWQRKELMDKYGPGYKEKTAVVGFLERGGKVFAHKIDNADRETLQPAVRARVKKGAKLMTDGLGAYAGLKNEYEHSVVNHDKGEYAVGEAHTNTIEGFWGIFKRCIFGIYHNVSPKHLDRYCGEISHRYNERNLSQDEKFTRIVKKCNGRLKFADLTFNEEDVEATPETPKEEATEQTEEIKFASMQEYKKYKDSKKETD